MSLFEGNDINFINLECAITEREESIEKIGPALKAPFELAEVLASVGVNYCGLSNNHSFDFGKAGMEDTFRALNAAGITYTGFGNNDEDARRNLVIEKDGERISLIAVCEKEYTYALEDRMGARAYDEYDTMEDIRVAKANSDRVIVIYHGGKEHCKFPSPRLRKLCHAMAKNGADVILGQHSHCISCYENVNGTHILYGQGNFHFVRDSFFSETSFDMWNTSLAVFYDTKSNAIEFVPLIANNDCDGLRMPTDSEKKEILSAFEARNEMLKNGEWKTGWQEFCQSVAKSYRKYAYQEVVSERQQEIFAHFLDCQAHTDVWREIFPTKNLTNEK